MSDKERLVDAFTEAKATKSAVPGLRVNSFVEAEAVLDAVPELRTPILFMVSAERRNISAFVKALKGFGSHRAFIQLIGEDPEILITMAQELDVDAVFLTTATVAAAQVL